MDHGLNVKCKTINLKEKKNKKNLQNLGLEKYFLDWTLKSPSVKGKTDKSDHIKIKKFCFA